MSAHLRNVVRGLRHDDRGSVDDLPGWTIVLLGVFVPIFLVILFVGRYGLADNAVQAAASAAARDASLSRTEAQAVPHATAAAQQALDGNVHCIRLNVAVDGNGLNTALGQTGTVSATITCTLNFADLALPMIPGTKTITKTAVSPIDPYRQR